MEKLIRSGVVFDPLTGEVIPDLTKLDIVQLSDTLRHLYLVTKRLQEIETEIKVLLEPIIAKAIEDGEQEIAGYWKIQNGRVAFDKTLFATSASAEEQERFGLLQQEIKEITDKYSRRGKPFIKASAL